MHSRQHARRTRTTVLALGALVMSGVAATVGAPSASAAAGPVVVTGQCSVELFSGPNLTGDSATAQTNPFSIRSSTEIGDWNLYFEEVRADLSGVGGLKDSANSVRVTCTFDSVNGRGANIHAVPVINTTTQVPDPSANGCSKAEGLAIINAGAVGVLKTYVSNQLPVGVAGNINEIGINLRQQLSRTSCP